MPKRSRSASPLPSGDTASVDEDAPAVKSSTTDPAHNPKYFRSSTSPSPDPSSSAKPPVQQMQCGLPPHGVITLPSAAAFDEHYAKEHTNRCSACGANLPSAWFLELHLSERHDPLIATRREKEEKTYHCFIQTCDKITLTPQKRRLHLIDKHQYPKDYDFRVVHTGLRGKMSLLKVPRGGGRKRRVSEAGDIPTHQGGLGGSRGRSRRNTLENISKDATTSPPIEEAGDEMEEDTKSTEINHDASSPPKAETQKLPKASVSTNDDMETLRSGIAALRFIPTSVRMRKS